MRKAWTNNVVGVVSRNKGLVDGVFCDRSGPITAVLAKDLECYEFAEGHMRNWCVCEPPPPPPLLAPPHSLTPTTTTTTATLFVVHRWCNRCNMCMVRCGFSAALPVGLTRRWWCAPFAGTWATGRRSRTRRPPSLRSHPTPS